MIELTPTEYFALVACAIVAWCLLAKKVWNVKKGK